MIVTLQSLTPIDFHGLRIFDYTARQDLGSSVAVIEVPPAARHAEAWSRRSDKYYLVTNGVIRFVLDGAASDMGAGDFCVVRCGEHFSYSNERAEMATLVLVHTPGFSIEQEVFAAPETTTGEGKA